MPLSNRDKTLVEQLLDTGMNAPTMARTLDVSVDMLYNYLQSAYGGTRKAYESRYRKMKLPAGPHRTVRPLLSDDLAEVTRLWMRSNYGSVSGFAKAMRLEPYFVTRKLHANQIPKAWLTMMGIEIIYVVKET